MTMIEGPTSLILFRDPVGADTCDADPELPLKGGSLEYLRSREHAERAAAKRAASPAARRIHQELAERYARELNKVGASS